MKLIGLEGSAYSAELDRLGVTVTYGAAAFQLDSGAVLNPVTQARCSATEWEGLVKEGNATQLEPHEVPIGYAFVPCFVLVARPGELLDSVLKQQDPTDRCVDHWAGKDLHTFLFPSFEDLNQFGDRVTTILRCRDAISDQLRIDMMVLDPWDGMTQAGFVEAMQKTAERVKFVKMGKETTRVDIEQDEGVKVMKFRLK